MKRNNLTTAVVAAIAGVAGFAGLANAVDLNPDGLGQVLIYPYYTVNANQNSLFSVVNTTGVGKAVKVRFLEGYNSREVLDFNLFLSPHDVWTAAVTAVGDATTGAKITTFDHSCTSPAIPAGGQPFSSAAYTGHSIAPFNVADGGPQTIDRTREGYLELILMGDIIPGSATDSTSTHVQTGVPNAGTPQCDQGILASAGVPQGSDLMANLTGGGLFGAGSVINVGQGTFYGYTADAVDGFSNQTLFSGTQSLQPSLQDAHSATAVAPNTASAFVFVNGGLVQADYVNGIDAVSAVFMADSLYNEFIVGAGLGANTDWIVTFPTKRFYVDTAITPTAPLAPFTQPFTGDGTTAGSGSNVVVGINLFDREEFQTTAVAGFSPPVGSVPNALPYEVNVISFLNGATAGGVSGVFSSVLRPNITPLGDDGWLQLGLNDPSEFHSLPGGTSPTAGAVTFNGLPATGYEGYNVINSNANPGLLANYGGLFRHRASRSCASANHTLPCS